MRPLLRPGRPGTYPDFSVTSTYQQLIDDLWEVNIARPSAQIRTALNIARPTAISLADVTWGLRLIAINPPPRRKRNADGTPPPRPTALQAARDALMRRVVNQYSEANDPLRAGLGRFCSYCEQTLSEFIATEHVVPKAPWPLTSVSWDNFLLSCRACNSFKWDHPDRDELAAWRLNPAPADDLESYREIRGYYLWPDTSVNAYRGLLPVLYYRSTTGWQPVPTRLSVADGVRCVDHGREPDKIVIADIPSRGRIVRAQVRVLLVAGGVDATFADRTLRVNKMDLTGVNKGDDSRMWDRTQRWLEAVETFTDLSQAWSPQLWNAAIRTARTGFLSTWVRVLELRGGRATAFPIVPRTSMMEAFVTAMTQQVVQPFGAYPGTDVNYIP